MASEVCLLAFLTVVESVRISLGKRGNLTERSPCLALSVVLTVPSVLGALYFLLWQTYVLRLDWVLAAGQVALQALQTLLAVTTMVAIK
ncbi:transmembrane protein 80 [Rhipicephalus sanguineus]|nr:transmembrane protein 80 [Rhipicephalus sanguineus]